MDDSFAKQVTRAWSAIVAKGGEGTAAEVAHFLNAPESDVARCLAALRAQGALP